MTPLAIIFVIVLSAAILAIPRQHVITVLFIGFCYMTKGQGIDIGPFFFSVYRLLMAVCTIRAILRSEHKLIQINKIDKFVLWLLGSLFVCSFFHNPEIGSGPIYVSGVCYDIGLCYFLIRAYTSEPEHFEKQIAGVLLVLAPVAVFMALELIIRRNFFSAFGGVPLEVIIRDGKLRAQGPFRHPILAGTVGAGVFAYALAIFRRKPILGTVSILSSLTIVVASNSSGPILATAASVGALCLWKFRRFIGPGLKAFAVVYVILSFIREKSPIFLVARLDVTGSSTGYHRALLIDQTMSYFGEWWLWGTDRTRHWMPNQGRISEYHTDITNYFISFAIGGGIWALAFITLALFYAYRRVGALCNESVEIGNKKEFLFWSLGAALFSHNMSGMSVAYFDQSMVFFWLSVALISSATNWPDNEEVDPDQSDRA